MLFAAGDGGGVVVARFDALWRSYRWTRPLPPARFRGLEFGDVAVLAPVPGYPDRLLGLSSDGCVAMWDTAR